VLLDGARTAFARRDRSCQRRTGLFVADQADVDALVPGGRMRITRFAFRRTRRGFLRISIAVRGGALCRDGCVVDLRGGLETA